MRARNRWVSRLLVPLAATSILASVNAAAASDEWSVGLGAGGGWSPEYRGADTYKADGIPWIQAKKGRVSIDPVTGVSYDLLASKRWKLAPMISYAEGRDNSGALNNFEDVHGSVIAGVIYSWTSGSWQIAGDVAAPVSGDLEGVRVRSYLRYSGRLAERWFFAAGPGATWGDNRWNRTLFDVSAVDAARSGLNSYRADGDYIQGNINGRLTFMVTHKLSVSTVARYSRLFGDALDSPIIDDVGDPNQWHGSMAINYQF